MGENVQFVNIFGYRHTDVDYYSSVDGLPTLISDGTGAIPAGLPVTVVGGRQISDVEQLTDEVQFNDKLFDDKLDWLTGGFYLKIKQTGPSKIGISLRRERECQKEKNSGVRVYSNTKK